MFFFHEIQVDELVTGALKKQVGLGSFNRIIKHEAKNLRLFFHCSFRD